MNDPIGEAILQAADVNGQWSRCPSNVEGCILTLPPERDLQVASMYILIV
ncbi:MAG: hypothetical protein ACTHLW_14550 [Verrucomicrobiota bacterium]